LVSIESFITLDVDRAESELVREEEEIRLLFRRNSGSFPGIERDSGRRGA